MVVYYYLGLTLIAFLIWGYDKLQAKANGWRIPERKLIALVLAGGAFGAFLGMQLFRHKTRKPTFQVLVPASCVLHAVLFYILNT